MNPPCSADLLARLRIRCALAPTLDDRSPWTRRACRWWRPRGTARKGSRGRRAALRLPPTPCMRPSDSPKGRRLPVAKVSGSWPPNGRQNSSPSAIASWLTSLDLTLDDSLPGSRSGSVVLWRPPASQWRHNCRKCESFIFRMGRGNKKRRLVDCLDEKRGGLWSFEGPPESFADWRDVRVARQ